MSGYNLVPGVDENYEFPPEVREALIRSLNIKNTGAALTTAERNALSTAEMDSGYYIFNTDVQTFQIWRADFEEWHDGLEAPGSVKEWPGVSIPPGWMKQDGRALNRQLYKALYARIGTTYGVGNNATTFNIPNRGGRMTVDVDGSYHLGKQGGQPTVPLYIDNLPSHNHGGATGGQSANHDHHFTTGGESARHYHLPFADGGYYIIEGVPGNGPYRLVDKFDFLTDNTQGGEQAFGFNSGSSTGLNQGDHTHSGVTNPELQGHVHGVSAQGGNVPHENMPPYHSAHLIIKY